MILQRTIYLGYYIRHLKWGLLKKFLTHVSKVTGISQMRLMLESIKAGYTYNISILEYFQFGFYNKSGMEKEKWAGTGTMYEFQRIANPPEERSILDDKRLFYSKYNEFIKHRMFTVEELKDDHDLVDGLCKSNEKLVLKEAHGKAGSGVRIINTDDIESSRLAAFMETNQLGVMETYIKQHHALQKLSPSAINTIRVMTQIRKDGTYEILGCRLRISVDSPVDNMAAGNLVAPVDVKTGKVNGKAVYSDITKKPVKNHPITDVEIPEFQVPFWDDVLKMTKEASLKYPQNRSVGWDIAVTPNGPDLIEGNHDWCKLVWQLPVHKGLKHRLDM